LLASQVLVRDFNNLLNPRLQASTGTQESKKSAIPTNEMTDKDFKNLIKGY